MHTAAYKVNVASKRPPQVRECAKAHSLFFLTLWISEKKEKKEQLL